jgi:hypothetical protein
MTGPLASDVDDACLCVAFEAYTPVADLQAPFVGYRGRDE